MSALNKIAVLVFAGGLLSAPVFADGVSGQKINRGPTPLKAHTMTPPEPGCVLNAQGKWSCPIPPARFTNVAPTQKHYTTTTHHNTARHHTSTSRSYTTTRRSHAPVVTRRVVSAPTTMTIDTSGFTGGVGVGLGGEPVYGNGTGFVVVQSGERFSGLSSRRNFAFSSRKRGGKMGGGKRGGGHK
ncbi:MAG: hypothetical protein AAF296_09670 [Pseudomonadota bacterium]